MSKIDIDIAEYLGLTLDFSTQAHGACLLLMCHYRMTQTPIPDNDTQLALITRLDIIDWEIVRPQVERMFKIEAGKWWHEGILEQIDKSQRAREKATKASRVAHGVVDPSPPPIPTATERLDAVRAEAVAQSAKLRQTMELANQLPGEKPAPAPEPPADPIGTLLAENWQPDQARILACLEHASADELAGIIDAFIRYHEATGTMSTDWDATWDKWWERKKPARVPEARVEISRRRKGNAAS